MSMDTIDVCHSHRTFFFAEGDVVQYIQYIYYIQY